MPITEFTPKKREKFLDALREIPNVTRACGVAHTSRPTVYNLRKADTEFSALWDDALDQGVEAMEQEAMRRAVEGTDHPVVYQGVVMDTYKEYSDTLLIFLLKAHKPERYRDQVEHQGNVTLLVKYDG